MTNLGILERQNGPEMSEAGPSFEVTEISKEVDQMTAVLSNTAFSNTAFSSEAISTRHFHDVPNTRGASSTGLTRVAVFISIALLNWAARRAERGLHSAAEQALIVSEARERASREHHALLLQARQR
jgi:hypothetical protein